VNSLPARNVTNEHNFKTDKFQFKKYVSDILGSDDYTAKLYGNWYSIDSFEKDWSLLPKSFVLKSNLSYNGNNIKFILDKDKEDVRIIATELSSWLDPRNTMMNTCSCRLYNATPCILAEEYICQEGHTSDDYKFFCFNGVPKYIYSATEHFNGEHSCISFYDMKWMLVDVKYGDYHPTLVEKPAQFDEMVSIAKKMSAGFPFVRVDFFNVNGRLILSELTFDSGDGHRKFQPTSFDEELGSYFKI